MDRKIEVISNGKLDSEGLKKVGKSFLISLAGAGIIFLGDITQIADFGSWQTYLATMLPFAVNFLRKWLGKYESKA